MKEAGFTVASLMPKSVFTDAYASFLNTLIEARKRQGVTQAVLAERLGKPQSFVAKVEQGARRLDVVEFYALARALGLSPTEFYAEVVERFPYEVDI